MALSNFFWDTNVTAMPDDTLIPDGPQAWRYLIANIPALFGSEHHTFPTGSNIGAWHLPGSANIFVETTVPTTRVDGQAFDANDIGRLWYDTTLGIFKILTAIATDVWTPLPSLTAANNYTGSFAINTDKFTVDEATGDTAIAGTLEAIGLTTVADGSVTKTNAVATAPSEIANLATVDAQVLAATDPTYTGGQGHNFIGGLQFRHGFTSSTGAQTINYADFGTACISMNLTEKDTVNGGAGSTNSHVKTLSKTSAAVWINTDGQGVYWQAWGY